MTPRRVSEMPFRGGGELVRLLLRRDRVRIAWWAAGIIALVLVSVESITGLYSTPLELERYAKLVKGNAALIVQSGPGYGLDHPTAGAVLMNETGVWTYIAVGLMSVFMVVRHTRTEEENELAELIRSAPVGRHAQLLAALLGTLLANALVATGLVLGLIATDLPTVGSLAFAAATIGAGMVFAGVAAVAAQVASGSRSALAAASGTIALAFVARAVGDVGDGRLSWLSPIGWAQAIRAYADERWWVLLLPAVAVAGCSALAVSLQTRRDLGAGMFQQRPGPAAANPRLSTPLGLAARLHRPTIIGWTIGLALLAFFYGIVANQAESILEDNPDMADYLAMLGQGSITDVYLATSMLMMGLIATGFTLAAVLRLRGEENAGRADLVLAMPTSRRRWVASHLALASGGSIVVMTACGLAMGVGFASVSGDTGKIPSLVVAALAMVPAMLAVGGLTLLVYGLVPRWALAVWGALAFIVAVGVLQAVLDLPQWVLDLSPFEHVPAMPAAGFDIAPLALLCAAALALVAAGLSAIERRDIV